MADCFSPEKRSENMRAIKSENTSCEVLLRRTLWKEGIRGYRIHRRDLPGKPDIAFSRQKVAVFVDGCFWHGCPRCFRMPQTNTSYWKNKIERNVVGALAATEKLREMGWKVIRLWEHDVLKNLDSCVQLIKEALRENLGTDRKI